MIAILAMIAMPTNSNRTVQLQVVESLELIEKYKENIEKAYLISGSFPTDNDAAGMPEPEEIKGNFLAALHVSDGILNLEFGQKMNEKHHGKILSVRPVYVDSESTSPISWICGFDPVPDGMLASAKNKTTLEIELLPIRCR